MMTLSVGYLISVFIAGVLMFFAPCTLPIVPAYLAFIAGVGEHDALYGSDQLHARRRIRMNGIAFVLGFAVVFIILGVLAGYIGSHLTFSKDILEHVGGVFIILFGLSLLGVFEYILPQSLQQLQLPFIATSGSPISAVVIGATFALGWTPCIGPVLASVFLLAATSSTVAAGTMLLVVFTLGLSMPFLLVAFFYARASAWIYAHQRVSLVISRTGAVFLIIIGALILSGQYDALVAYGYGIFEVTGLSALFHFF